MLPELLYMEAKWSSLARTFCRLIAPWTSKPCGMDTLKVAKRLEAELGEEQPSFIEGEPRDWDLLPLPEGSFTVGIDGGYLRNWVDKKHTFEVIVGKSIRKRKFYPGRFCFSPVITSLS